MNNLTKIDWNDMPSLGDYSPDEQREMAHAMLNMWNGYLNEHIDTLESARIIKISNFITAGPGYCGVLFVALCDGEPGSMICFNDVDGQLTVCSDAEPGYETEITENIALMQNFIAQMGKTRDFNAFVKSYKQTDDE